MVELARLLGNPESSSPDIHLTGTNGKGSTSTMTTALLLAMGLTVGTYTSPNLADVSERIAINGLPIDDGAFLEVLKRLQLLDGVLAERPTRFELLTMAAFAAFSDAAVDVSVIEAGLGGSWDSTNIVTGDVSVITNVGLDHMEVLGSTREAIAEDKSGIIKEGSIAVIGEPDVNLQELIAARANRVGAAEVLIVGRDFELLKNQLAVGGRVVSLRTPFGTYEDLFVGLHGPHQGRNALVAITATEAFFGRELPDDVVELAMRAVTMPGRLEVLGRSPLVVLDGAHNVAGVTALAEAVTEGFSVTGSTILVTGMLRGRDPYEMLAAIAPIGIDHVLLCTPDSPRAMAPSELIEAAHRLNLKVEEVPSIEDACAAALRMAGPDDLVLVAGSLYVAGTARTALKKLLASKR
ncbi:MAG: folylpolyglutamate synthase/dihydrofolate synthase family protein [Actinomycetota bacterium]